LRFAFAVLVGRLVRFAVRLVRPGGGSALPGLVVSKIAPNLLSSVLASFKDGVIVVTGSAGKSSTTKMVVAIAQAHGKRVFTNPTTANIRQGFYASILEVSSWLGQVSADIAVIEADEGHAPELLRGAPVRLVGVLNVTEDQLDRFVDPALVRDKLLHVALGASEGVVLNANDQNTLILADQGQGRLAETSFFGISESVSAGKFLGFAPTYLDEIVTPNMSTNVISSKGNHHRIRCEGIEADISLPNRGIHYASDAAAAIELSRRFLGSDFDFELAASTLQELPPVFARGEITKIRGIEVELVLVQNPASFQLNLDALDSGLDAVMVAIGRDVHDPSWLWTVDFAKLAKVQVVSGFNAAEMALCFAYKNVPVGLVSDDLELALDAFLKQASQAKNRPTILLSADAMRRYRRMLGFVSPDTVGSK